jgi:hypothetical protein
MSGNPKKRNYRGKLSQILDRLQEAVEEMARTLNQAYYCKST